MQDQKFGKELTRRDVLKAGLTGVVAIPLAAVVGSRRATAQNLELPKLAEDDPAANALGYRHDVASVDKAANPTFVEGSVCRNCQLYTGTPDTEWGPCSIFPGKLVNGDGWCRTWIKKAG